MLKMTMKAVAATVANVALVLTMIVPAQALNPTPQAIPLPFVPYGGVLVGRDGTVWILNHYEEVVEGSDGDDQYADERIQLSSYRIGGPAPTMVLDIPIRIASDDPHDAVGSRPFLAGTDAAGNLALFYTTEHHYPNHDAEVPFLVEYRVHYVRVAPDGTVLLHFSQPALATDPDKVWPDLAPGPTVLPDGRFASAHSLFSANGVYIGPLTLQPSPADGPFVIYALDDGRIAATSSSTTSIDDSIRMYNPDFTASSPEQAMSQRIENIVFNSVGDGLSVGSSRLNSTGPYVASYRRVDANANPVGPVIQSPSPLENFYVIGLTDNNDVFLFRLSDANNTNSYLMLYQYDASDSLVGPPLSLDQLPALSQFALARSGDVYGVSGQTLYRLVEPRCGDGTVDASFSEQCDDGNTSDLDGCASNCTLQVCGNSVVESGEGCDDGNVAGGDGCDSSCRLEEEVVTTASPGVPVSTDTEGDGATSGDPLEVTLTSPSGGNVSLTEAPQPIGGTDRALGQEVEITAPAETAAHPLVIELRLDSSVIPMGTAAAGLHVFSNGVVVPDCADASGHANPDPCVASRALQPDHDVVLTALSSHASTLFVGTVCGDGHPCSGAGCTSGPDGGIEQCDDGAGNSDTVPGACRTDCSAPRCGDGVVDGDEACDAGHTVDDAYCTTSCQATPAFEKAKSLCLNAIGKLTSKGIDAVMNGIGSCVKNSAESGIAPITCMTNDSNGKLGKALASLSKAVAKKCAVPMSFGLSDITAATAGVLATRNFTTDVLGSGTASGSKCQQSLIKASRTYTKEILGRFTDCIKSRLKFGILNDSMAIATCVPDAHTLADSRFELRDWLRDKCSGGFDPADYPGLSSPFNAVTTAACRTCMAIEQVYDIDLACDRLDDDSAINSSCPS